MKREGPPTKPLISSPPRKPRTANRSEHANQPRSYQIATGRKQDFPYAQREN